MTQKYGTEYLSAHGQGSLVGFPEDGKRACLYLFLVWVRLLTKYIGWMGGWV